MSRDRLKLILSDKPSDAEFEKMTNTDIINFIEKFSKAWLERITLIEECLMDEGSLHYERCAKCESKTSLRIKSTRFTHVYYCPNHYPQEIKIEPKRRTLDDIFGGQS